MVPERWALCKCQSSIKTIRDSHVWQSSPSMWLLTEGNILEQFGLIFGEQAPFLVPVYSVWMWPFATCSVLPLQGCLYSLRVNDVVLISGFGVFFMLMVDAWGLDELQMLLWRCLLHLTGDEDFVFQETQPVGTVPLDWLQGVCGPMHIVRKKISYEALVQITQDQELNFCQPTMI